ncbi:DUF4292 domain-containing protein [Aestuariivivens sediminicola]|uniref:DUF4292 domain-containing protein n=1 Tax=Aestuariivivens sediminicola TaxID=2913560 RepID=UPI001F56A9A6|nr:DUF4292 domain-containing protein [Aestuariivivens sediminicola]
MNKDIIKKFKYIVFTLLAIWTFNCKSSRSLGSGEANLNLSTKQVIRENLKRSPDFKTLSTRIKIDMDDGKSSKAYTINLRMEKDKQILLTSTPISVVKALITPDRVRFYNKLDRTYFDGGYTYLSEVLGTELDFSKVQNLLLGEALYNLKDDSYKSFIHENKYVLQPRRQQEIIEIFYLLNPSYFKIESQQLTQPYLSRHLQIDYLQYQEVNKQTLPERIKVIALEEDEELKVGLEYRGVSLNADLRFPFKIPSGYDEIKL